MATTTNAPGQPVDPSQAQGAQIPLQSFTLPNFPPEAGGLQALTLTSDLKLDEYQSSLAEPYTIPPLPRSIESLTLELFSLGYPSDWLSTLATRLPNIKSLVVYSQLLGGITQESSTDTVAFFHKLAGLRALHLLDVFAQPGLFESIAPSVTYTADGEENARRGLMFLEVNYTVQHSDTEFLSKVPAIELPKLVGPGLISCSFNVSEADETDDPEDPSNLSGASEQEKKAQDGIVAFNKTLMEGLVVALTAEESKPVNLRMLNSTLYTFTMEGLEKVLESHKGLMVLHVSLEIEQADGTRDRIVKLLEGCERVEQVEIVVNPSLQFFMAINNPRSTAMEQALPTKADMEALSKKNDKLSSFKANVLRSKTLGTVTWEKKDDKWTGGAKSNMSGAPDA